MNNEKKINRNYGIDLLRIIAMFFVVVLHSLGHGGVLNNINPNLPCYKGIWILEIIAYCAVDVFAIISGYVSYREDKINYKYSNYISLWLEVVFYGLICFLFASLINNNIFNKANLFKSIFPIINNSYWYFTAYTGVFIISPIIMNGMKIIDNKTLKKNLYLIILLFSVLSIFKDNFNFQNGYSFAWLLILFIIGAILKKCNILNNIKKYQLVLLIIMLYSITYFYKFYGFEFDFFDIKITKDLFISYVSPTILGVSILFVILFSKLTILDRTKKYIRFFTTSSFAIYLINDNFLIREIIIKDLFYNLASSNNILKIYFIIIIFSILFVIIATLIDKIRLIIFKKIKVERI